MNLHRAFEDMARRFDGWGDWLIVGFGFLLGFAIFLVFWGWWAAIAAWVASAGWCVMRRIDRARMPTQNR